MKSETIGKLAEALSKAQKQMKVAIKDSENPFFKSKYADLASVWEACRDALTDNGLAVVQTFERSIEFSEHVIIRTTLLHISGEWIEGELPMKIVKNDPQGIGSAITYGRRYALASIVGVIQEDDDAEKAVEHEVKMPERKTEATEKKRGAYISDAQRKRLYAIYKEAGKTDEDVKLYLNTVWKIESTREIPWKAYEDICKWAGDKETTPKADEAEALFDQEDANEDNIQ